MSDASPSALPSSILAPGDMRISLIAAVASNGVIGNANDLPWRIKDDMRFFKEKTLGHVVVSGRKNFDAMGKALPKRHNIVVTRDATFSAPAVEVANTIETALIRARALEEREVFVIGGAQIYELALPYAHTFYRTRVLAVVSGDVYFPQLDDSQWEVTELARYPKDEGNEHAFVIEELNRRSAPAPLPPA